MSDPTRRKKRVKKSRRRLPSQRLFLEIVEYVGFTDSDVITLKKIHHHISDGFGGVITHFYEAHQNNQHTSNIFENVAQIDRLHKTLFEWLNDLFLQERDINYWSRRWMVGEIHVEIGLKPQFMFGAMNIIRSELFKLIKGTPFIEDWLSVERAIDLDLMIMVQSYWDYVTDIKLKTPMALASGMAHEIRNPLNSLVLNLRLLERGGNFTEKEKEICANLQDEIERIKKTMTEMIDFTRPIDLVCRNFTSEEMEATLTHQFLEELAERNIEIIFEHEFNKNELEIYGDFGRLKQALINLIQNAANAIKEKGEITISFGHMEKKAKIRVADTGHGMRGKDMIRMFELFYTTRAEGTGLGLPIVKQIIESHDGMIDATSSRAGTEFIILLPGEKK